MIAEHKEDVRRLSGKPIEEWGFKLVRELQLVTAFTELNAMSHSLEKRRSIIPSGRSELNHQS